MAQSLASAKRSLVKILGIFFKWSLHVVHVLVWVLLLSSKERASGGTLETKLSEGVKWLFVSVAL